MLLALSGCQQQQSPPAGAPPKAPAASVLQLNGPCGPRFAAHYQLAGADALALQVRPGGGSANPLAEVVDGRAEWAVVESDLFLRYLGESASAPGPSDLVCVFADLQRSPVGWVVHPAVASRLGLTAAGRADARAVNRWAADQIRGRRLRVGDRRGTASTAAWQQWRSRQGLPADAPVVSVAADPSLTLSAPLMLFPVLLNTQAVELSERTAQDGSGEMVVVDPSADGVVLCGDLVVVRRQLLTGDPDRVALFQARLRRAWDAVRDDPGRAVAAVQERCSGVGPASAAEELRRTLALAYAGGAAAGQIDVRPDGAWSRTLRALQEAGSVSGALTIERVLAAMAPPK